MKLKIQKISFEKDLFEDIFSVALPASLSPIFTVGTVLVLTGLIGQFGTSAIAGYGIGSRVEFLLIPIVFSIGTAMTTMVGTNIGANNIDRAEKIGITGATSAGLLSGAIGLILALTPDIWIKIFTSDPSSTIGHETVYSNTWSLLFIPRAWIVSLLCISGSKCYEVAYYYYSIRDLSYSQLQL